jgi:mannose-6-phosphate isomerase-like protein (cupin superfamily)
MKISKAEGLEQLANSGKIFLELFTHGTLSVEIYKPDGIDLQKPHERDEVYFVISGHGTFFSDGKRDSFQVGDFLFVPAGIEHRFENFTDDFATWVIFYGPEGGEKNFSVESID